MQKLSEDLSEYLSEKLQIGSLVVRRGAEGTDDAFRTERRKDRSLLARQFPWAPPHRPSSAESVARGRDSRTVLIADDDAGTVETFSAALRLAGYSTVSESTGGAALVRLRTSAVDAAVVDLRLGDILGIDVLRSLRAEGQPVPFVLVSAFLDTPTTAEAMRLGAFDVLDKPLFVDHLCSVVARALTASESSLQAQERAARGLGTSSYERLARAILTARDARDDPRTRDWARLVGMSDTSLRGLCGRLGIQPHDARDLARMLRAVAMGRLQRCAPQIFLDTADDRTLRLLLARAGLDASVGVSPHDLLRNQKFVDDTHPMLKALRSLLAN